MGGGGGAAPFGGSNPHHHASLHPSSKAAWGFQVAGRYSGVTTGAGKGGKTM